MKPASIHRPTAIDIADTIRTAIRDVVFNGCSQASLTWVLDEDHFVEFAFVYPANNSKVLQQPNIGDEEIRTIWKSFGAEHIDILWTMELIQNIAIEVMPFRHHSIHDLSNEEQQSLYLIFDLLGILLVMHHQPTEAVKEAQQNQFTWQPSI